MRGRQAGRSYYYYHFDGLGSVIALSDENGEIVDVYEYDVYGKADCISKVGNPYRFTGRRFDDETGLYYYRARIYSAELGRFLQVDPIGYEDSMNLYQYCKNNPIVLIDPYGLCDEGYRSYNWLDEAMYPIWEDTAEWIDAIEYGSNYIQDFNKRPLNDKFKHMEVSYELTGLGGPVKTRTMGIMMEIGDWVAGEGANLSDLAANEIGIRMQLEGVNRQEAVEAFQNAADVFGTEPDIIIRKPNLIGPMIYPPLFGVGNE